MAWRCAADAGDADRRQVWWPRRGTQDGHAEALAQSITERRWSWNFVDRPSSLAEATWRAYPSERAEPNPRPSICEPSSAHAHRTVTSADTVC